jgi:hypothetical protein
MIPDEMTDAKRFQTRLEDEGIYADEAFAEAALNHPKLKALHAAWLKENERAIADAATYGVAITEVKPMKNGDISVSRLPAKKFFKPKRGRKKRV